MKIGAFGEYIKNIREYRKESNGCKEIYCKCRLSETISLECHCKRSEVSFLVGHFERSEASLLVRHCEQRG